MGRLKLFDDSGDAADIEDLSKIEINHDFAKRYEHNKKREELQKYEELKKSGRLSKSDSEDASDEEILAESSKKTDLEFLNALIKIKNQDPVLKSKDAKLFNSDSEYDSENESDGDNEKVNRGGDDAKKRKKPMYLKDVVWKHLTEAGPDFDDDEDEDEENGSRNNGSANKVKSYSEEQEEVRRDFLKVVEEEDDDDEMDFFRVKKGESKEKDEEEEGEIGNKLDEYFGDDEKLDEDTMFLKDYFRNRMWLDDGESNNTGGVEIEFSEDEEEIERQEDYEREFNFRFEENAGDRVMGHSRKVDGSVRKKGNSRKLQRERKEERMAQAEFERKEELKHLKNLKKKEIDEKLSKIREVAGIGEGGRNLLDHDYLEEEFDPDEYDRKMKEVFDKEYYEAEDDDPEFGSDGDNGGGFEKPDFDKEDELLGLPKSWGEVKESGEGFASVRQRILNSGLEDGDKNELLEDQDDEPKRKRKRKPSEVEKAVRDQLMEEYYKLDYEDAVGDLKTRFKYKPVKAKRYGLSAAQILMMDEKDLNQYVSVKKMAPYREKEWNVPRIKTVQLKQMNQKLLHGETSVSDKDKKKIRHSGQETTKALSEIEHERSLPKELNDTSNVSRWSKRRQRKAEIKPSHKRLLSFGKIPSKSKSKVQ